MKISEIYREENKGVITTEATLMEIVFEMTTKNNTTLFVVEDGILKGIIDRFNIIDKIFFISHNNQCLIN